MSTLESEHMSELKAKDLKYEELLESIYSERYFNCN